MGNGFRGMTPREEGGWGRGDERAQRQDESGERERDREGESEGKGRTYLSQLISVRFRWSGGMRRLGIVPDDGSASESVCLLLPEGNW